MSAKQETKARISEQHIPITVCPDCVEAGLQVDPRAKTPAYPVIESVCSTHQPGFYKILIHPSSAK